MLVRLLAAFSLGVPVVMAAPKPSLAPKSWELELEFHDPARIAGILPGARKPSTFWYMIYSVTNRTGREVHFYPQFDLVTDTLKVYHGGDHVSPSVFAAIRERHRKQHPFLTAPLKASGKLLQGVDNARTSVAIFTDFDPQASRFAIYAAGLSGEVVRVPNPAFDSSQPPSEQNVQFFTLRKTLGIGYDMPGDVTSRIRAKPVRTGREFFIF